MLCVFEMLCGGAAGAWVGWSRTCVDWVAVMIMPGPLLMLGPLPTGCVWELGGKRAMPHAVLCQGGLPLVCCHVGPQSAQHQHNCHTHSFSLCTCAAYICTSAHILSAPHSPVLMLQTRQMNLQMQSCLAAANGAVKYVWKSYSAHSLYQHSAPTHTHAPLFQHTLALQNNHCR